MSNTNLVSLWNETVVSESKPIKQRDYLYASEIGKSDIDAYLAMKGEKPTNAPDLRSKRKFDVGNLFEGIVANVLDRAGVVVWLPKKLKRIRGIEKGMVDVSGRFDILLDGKADMEKAKAEAEKELAALKVDNPFEEYRLGKMIAIADRVIKSGKELVFDMVLTEVKSLSLMMFNSIETSEQPIETHAMQLFHYTRYSKFLTNKIGRLFYVCRDDIRLIEFAISDNPESKYGKMYMESLKRKSEAYKKDKMPAKEKMLVTKNGKSTTNFNVAYSSYLTKLHGYANHEEYRDDWSGKAASWNRVITRVVKGDNMTKSNLDYIKEMREHFGKEGYDQVVKDAIKESQRKYAMEKKGKKK